MPAKPISSQFSQSINIVRDADRSLAYYPTDNTKRIYHQLVNDYKLGTHVFNIIGSYGTGKSAFLWALEQNLIKGKPYFSAATLSGEPIAIIRLVGDYRSLTEVLAQIAGVEKSASNQEIFSGLFYQYKDAIQNGLLVILIDEFGKYLEFASANEPEKEIYFIQELAEFVNHPDYHILLVSTIHQNFDAYAFALTHRQRQEWSKVKGRFREITFNEPVEQLLRLAGEHLRVQTGPKDADQEIAAMQIADLVKRAAALELSPSVSSDVALDLFPLDLMAANILTLSLQRYGQNERSLFSFLESSDHTSLNKIRREDQFYHLARVYDYLLFNFYAFLQSKYNPDFSTWMAIRNALDEVDRTTIKQTEDCRRLIKTIGLLQLMAARGSRLDKDFLVRYGTLCLKIDNAGELIEQLKTRKTIIYRQHLQRFVLNEGTDLDMEAALMEAGNKISQVNDVATLLKRYYTLPPVLAKAYTYETGTPRIFEFVITGGLKFDQPKGEVDGFIYLLFDEQLSLEKVKAYSAAKMDEPVLYVYYENSKSVKDVLFELEKLRKVKEENSEDKVAVRLLNQSLEAGQQALNHFILGHLHSGSPNLKWIWNGDMQPVGNKRSFNQLLSKVCKTAYPLTPVFINELVNKHKISPSIATARKSYFRVLVNNWNQSDLGFEKDKFPPEKTIYLSLIKENHISIALGDIKQEGNKQQITALWDCSLKFLEDARERRKSILDFQEMLSARPFKLKMGLISFWLPTFLFIKRDEFALFGENGYIPYLSEETLDLIIRYPEKYEIKTFDIDGVRLALFNRYRAFLQQDNMDTFDNQAFIETIRPFLTFYKQLPDFVKQTKINLSAQAIALRTVISTTEDPERTFFEEFPAALGYPVTQLLERPELIGDYIDRLEASVKELRTCFELLVNRFEQYIQQTTLTGEPDFEDYRDILIRRFSSIRPHLVEANQKTFLQRLSSGINDRKAWLNSIAQSLIGKPLESFRDDDELLLQEKWLLMVTDLDRRSELTGADFDPHTEDILGFEMNTFIDGVTKTIVRLPKNKRVEIAVLEDNIRKMMTASPQDQRLQIVALANIIKELLQS